MSGEKNIPGKAKVETTFSTKTDVDALQLPSALSNSNQKKRIELLHMLTAVVVILTAIVTAIGLFYKTHGASFNFINQYGDVIRIWGTGIYSNDSYFRAPIFRGTDFTMLFVSVPLLIIILIIDVVKKLPATRLLMVSVLTVFLYYATSISFGVQYNSLHLVYIALFSASFFAVITGFRSVDLTWIKFHNERKAPLTGIKTFLIITGIALFVAWLPIIFAAYQAKRPLMLIEHYTTEITYVLDMGIIAPACFITFYMIRNDKPMGFLLLQMILTLCIIIGIMLPVQTLFQVRAGIEMPVAVLVTKVAIFSMLAIFAFYLQYKCFKNFTH